MSYPDVVIACIEHKGVLKHSEQLRQRWWSTIIWRIIPGGWLITITANHSNYFSLWQSQHAVCHCQKVKLQLNYRNSFTKWIYNIVLFGGKNADVHSSSLNWCICSLSDVSSPDGRLQWPRLRNSRTFFAQGFADESHTLLGKRMLRVVVLRVLFFVDMRLPRIQCRWFVLSEVVFTLSWCRSINTIPAS